MLDAIKNRRSIRVFNSKKVEEEKINELLKAGMQAPSAKNQQAWKFIVITSKDIIVEIANMSKYSNPCLTASLVIIPCIDKNKITTPNYVEHDLSLASENIMLEAVNQGLSSVILGTYPDKDRVNFLIKLLKLDSNLVPFSTICLGYSLNDDDNHYIDRFNKDNIIRID